MEKYNKSADLIRVLAIFSVVLLHTSAGPFKVWSENWMQFNILMSATRWCVPVLFMLSGALLIEKDEPLKVFFLKRASKILIPLVFWSYVYIFFARNFYELDPAHANPNVFIEPWLLLKYPAYFHMWFLYAVIGVYLMIPLLRTIAKNTMVTIYSLILWGVWFSVVPFMQTLGVLDKKVFFIFSLDVIPMWSGFALLGFFIQQNLEKIKSFIGLILMLSGFISTVILTYIVSNHGIPSETYQSYFMPNVVVMSCGIYIYISKIRKKYKIAQELAKYSFGIYLCHMVVMPLVWQIELFNNNFLVIHGAATAILSALITFTASLCIVAVFYRIPILKRAI